jgi:hypothetical protein
MHKEIDQNDMDPVERIKSAISKTGFLLERYVSDILESKKWTVINNRYYIDLSNNCQRELDILAYKASKKEEIVHYFVLLISCKKSEENDWVFLTKPIRQNDPNIDFCPQLLWTNSDLIKCTKAIEKVKQSITKEIANNANISELMKIENNVYAFQEVSTRKPNPKDDKPIYSSIDSLLKAANYELNTINAKKSEELVYHFNFITVFEGTIFEALVTENDPKIQRVDSTKYVNRFIVNNIDEFYRLHFCSKEYFSFMVDCFDSLWEFENKQIDGRIDEYKKYFLSNYTYRNAMNDKIVGELRSTIRFVLQDISERQIIDIQSIWLETDEKAKKLVIEIDFNDDEVEILNDNQYLKSKMKYLLKKYCRYEGDFSFSKISTDIPY